MCSGMVNTVIRISVDRALQRHNVDILLDIGANVGQFGQMMRLAGYNRQSFPLNRCLSHMLNWKILRAMIECGSWLHAVR